LLAALPPAITALAIVALIGHAGARRPAPPPTLVLGPDGTIRLPGVAQGAVVLCADSRVTPFWVRLSWQEPASRRELLLFADQLGRPDWARLSAGLRRGALGCGGNRVDQADLR